jgi:hypothetical protein
VALTLDDLERIVQTRDFNTLIGETEGRFLDVKRQPYQFDSGMHAKREFAKDVASFANAAGGYILVGIATRQNAVRAGEEISEIRPLERAVFDIERHRKILLEWLYPQPLDVQCDWIQFGSDHARGVGVIFIPPQSPGVKPFLIKRTVEDRKGSELLIGYAERRFDTTEIKTVVEIQQALRTGLNLERELLGRIAGLELRLDRYSSVKTAQDVAEGQRQLLKDRIARLLHDAEMEG